MLVSDVGLPPDPGDAAPTGDGIGRGRVRRTIPLAALSARTAGEAVVVGLRGRLTGADSTEFHVRTAERYAELLGRSKGALMKAGQMLSFVSVAPAVPAEFQSIYQTALTRLRDDAPPMAPELARVCSSASSAARPRARSRSSIGSRSRRPRSARCTPPGCTTVARSR